MQYLHPGHHNSTQYYQGNPSIMRPEMASMYPYPDYNDNYYGGQAR